MSGMYNYNPEVSEVPPPKWLWLAVIVALVICGIWCLHVYKQIIEMNSAMNGVKNCSIRITKTDIPTSTYPVLGALVASHPIDIDDTVVPDSIHDTISYYADKWEVNYEQMVGVIKCESNFRHEVYGDNGLAYGLCQFHKPTFLGNCDNCDYYSLEDQLDTMGKMWSIGKQSHWTCWTRLYGS